MANRRWLEEVERRLAKMACRRAIFGGLWKNCPIISRISESHGGES